MKQYLELLEHILIHGVHRQDRTGTGTISCFGHQMRISLTEKFPLLTTKYMHWKSIVHELLWFISGNTNIKYLKDSGVNIWNEWADENGNLGPIYGKQWRAWQGIDENHNLKTQDQLQSAIDTIKNDPFSRRIIISAWNVSQLYDMKLPPCHLMFQFYVQDNNLSCQVYQRSADIFLGIPFNIASYSLLLHMIAHITGKKAYELIYTLGDAHIYHNHINQVKIQMTRKPYPLPNIKLLKEVSAIDEFKFNDIELINYQSHPKLTGKIAI